MLKKYYLPFVVFMNFAALCLAAGQATAATPQIASGYYHNVVLDVNGTVWTWGGNGFGQLCDSNRPSPDATPKPIPGLTDVVTIAAGPEYTLAVKSDGTVWSCGANGFGQLGRGYLSDYERDIGMVVDPDNPANSFNLDADGTTGLGVVSIAAGSKHALAVRDDGTVWGWGANAGKLGADEMADSNDPKNREICGGTVCLKPIKADNITNARAVAAGLYHSMALDAAGSIWTWGSNNYRGQLGRGAQLDWVKMKENLTTYSDPGYPLIEEPWGYTFIPAKIADINGTTITGVTRISTGSLHSLAVARDGKVYGWGVNDEYQVLTPDTWPTGFSGWVHKKIQPVPVTLVHE
ncbi:MAG: hypothetical protein RQ753_00120, partial [Desulfurivibrionaceae bacterium]|nr:hypothetical protein [Desulfurivibrionaceae bacterium]